MDWQKDTGRYIARQVPQQAFQQSLAITKSYFRVVNHYAIPTVLLLTRFHFCPIQMFQEMIIRKLTPHIICSIDARSASSSAYRIRGSPLPTALRQSVIDRTENWQNDQQMSLCHAQKVLCRGLSVFWTNILRGALAFSTAWKSTVCKNCCTFDLSRKRANVRYVL